MRHASKLIALPLLVCASLLAAQNAQAEVASHIPASIHQVTSGGSWSQGKQEGFYRAVVTARGIEHVSHRLYIQWLRVNPQKQRYELIRTVGVKEINAGHGQVLSVHTTFGNVNAFRINVTAKTPGGKSRRYVISVRRIGRYSIRSR